jgi:hypothetical protein
MTLQRNVGRQCIKKVGPLSSDYVSCVLEYWIIRAISCTEYIRNFSTHGFTYTVYLVVQCICMVSSCKTNNGTEMWFEPIYCRDM